MTITVNHADDKVIVGFAIMGRASVKLFTLDVRALFPGRAFSIEKFGRSGLGLSIAMAISREHGGSLSAQNHPEGGMLLLLILPMKIES